MEKHLLIDLGHLSHRLLFGQANNIKSAGFGLLRHALLRNGIFHYIGKFEPTSVFIGVDYKKSWRKDETAIYKANRSDHRDKHASVIDWTGFYEFMDSFLKELRENFPFYTLAIPRLEADDIIGHLASSLPKEDEKIIVTSDTDYIQLLKYKNTKLFCPMKEKFVECVNPHHYLEMKIICGDRSDNIPPLRKGFGPKTVEKLIDTGEIYKLLKEVDNDGNPCELRRNYDRNQRLIDLTFTPSDLLNQLDEQIKNYVPSNGSSLFKYLVSNQLRDMLGETDKYRRLLSKINQKVDLPLKS